MMLWVSSARELTREGKSALDVEGLVANVIVVRVSTRATADHVAPTPVTGVEALVTAWASVDDVSASIPLDAIMARITPEHVSTLRVEDVVRAASTARVIATDAGTDCIPSGTASDSVLPPIATEAVATAATHKPVVPARSLQVVVAGPAHQYVVTPVTLEMIVTLSPAQDVVAAEASDPVVASASADDIALRGTAQIIVLLRANDRACGASPITGGRKRSPFHDRRGQDDRERDGGQ